MPQPLRTTNIFKLERGDDGVLYVYLVDEMGRHGWHQLQPVEIDYSGHTQPSTPEIQ